MVAAALNQAFGIAGQLISFEIDAIPNGAMAQRRDAPGVGNHSQGETGSVRCAAGHREADAIDGDAGLVADVAPEAGIIPAQLQLP